MTHVLLGDDDSAGSDLAWFWVNAQRWDGGRLTVLRADPPAYGAPAGDESARPTDPWRTAVESAGFGEIEFCVADADPRVALLAAAADADLVVVGPAGHGMGPRLVGSTTEWLLHDPPAPIVLARRGRTVRRVVLCADGSEHANAAAGALADLPWASSLEIDVVAVDDGRTDAAAAIESSVAKLASTGATISTTTLEGRRPHREILSHLDRTDTDLVALGTHGLSTLRRLTLGSTANAVAQLAPCSVLVWA